VILKPAALLLLYFALASPGVAGTASANTLPRALPMPASIPEPQDIPYPGEVRIRVDATDVNHRIFKVHESLPVKAGSRLTLLFPQWTTGDHTPNGPLDKLAGLVVKAGDKRIPWERDPVQVYAFHIAVPAGTTQLDLEYQFLSSLDRRSGAMLINPLMLDLQWQTVVLYPAGYYARDIMYRPEVLLPDGWRYVSALDGGAESNRLITFPQVPLDTLVDSPLMAAKYLKQISLSTAPVPVRLNVAVEDPSQLEQTGTMAADYSRATAQANKLFGSHHYDHYDFMLWLSDDFGPVYYEHHRSGENSGPSNYLAKYQASEGYREIMLHGYVHSWDGTFRRPAEMWTPNFNTPERDGLLWIFEGLTMYWEDVLAVRSGMATYQEELDSLADLAARSSIDAGSQWRAFQDVNYSPIFSFRRPEPWSTWQRGMFNAYSEGELIWLEVDLILRAQTHGKRSLDDFAKSFFGMHDGSYQTETYSMADVENALQTIAPYDWHAFFGQLLNSYSPGMSVAGLANSGYKVEYDAEPASPENGGSVDLTFSIGIMVDSKGALSAVHWDGPAYQAGAAPNETITAVNDKPYSADLLRAAVRSATREHPLRLMVQNGPAKETLTIPWDGGLRYPRLKRDAAGEANLDAIFRAPA
jgi:predicted metalloprotease with PDZ domain